MEPPAKPSVHVPYNLLAFLVKMAPKECLNEFVTDKLRSYGYLQKEQTIDADLAQRIEYAFNWTRDFEEIKETTINLTDEEKKAIVALVNVLVTLDSSQFAYSPDQREQPIHLMTRDIVTVSEADRIQNAIFNAAKSSGLKPGAFFKMLYAILMGAPQGPRLGPYILAMGKQNVIAALQRALSKN